MFNSLTMVDVGDETILQVFRQEYGQGNGIRWGYHLVIQHSHGK